MSEKCVKLEITDICDELSEELRQSLFEKQFILVSDLTQNSNSVQFENELISENKRLKNDLKFANNCLNTLNKFKRYLNEIRHKFEYLLDLKEKQELIDLEIEYKLMINAINERIKSKQSFGNNDKPIEKSINGNVFIENYENNQNSNNKEVFSEDKRYNGKEVEENELKSIGKDIEKREELSEISEFICDFIGCNKSFKRRDYLREHRKIHFPRELKSCKLCSFQTFLRSGVAIHMSKEHPNDTPYQCTECGDRFKRMGTLKLHTIAVHPYLRTFKCHYNGCDRVFSSQKLRRTHITDSHKKLLNLEVECDFIGCNKKFKNKDYLRAHKKIHFPRPLYSCELCLYQTHSRSGLPIHMNKWHRNDQHLGYAKSDMSSKTGSEVETPLAQTELSYNCNSSNDLVNTNDSNNEVIDIKSEFIEIYFENDFVNEIEVMIENEDKTGIKVEECLEVSDRAVGHNNEVINQIQENVEKSVKNINEIEEQIVENKTKIDRNREQISSDPDFDENDSNFDINSDSDDERETITKHQLNNTLINKINKELDDKCNEKIDKNEKINNCNTNSETESENIDTNSSEMSQRITTTTDEENGLFCVDCRGKQFETLKQLKEHKRHHNLNFICHYPQCKQNFSKFFEFRKHMDKHLLDSNLNAFKCQTIGCSFETTNYNQLKRHDLRVHKLVKQNHEKRFECDYTGCDKVFVYSKTLSAHIKLKHQMSESSRFSCKVENCNRIFSTRVGLNTHLARHYRTHIFRCFICAFGTECKDELQNHMKNTHPNDKPFVCTVCGKSLRTKSSLKQHILTKHSNERPVKCKYTECVKTFKTTAQRYKHINEEHKKIFKQFPCVWPGCGFVAKSNNNLKHHKYIHTGERPYLCTWPECGKDFRTEAAFSTHMRLHADDRKYVCVWPGCDYRTTDRSSLRFHKTRHEKQKSIQIKSKESNKQNNKNKLKSIKKR